MILAVSAAPAASLFAQDSAGCRCIPTQVQRAPSEFERRSSGSFSFMQSRPQSALAGNIGLGYGVNGAYLFRLDDAGIFALRADAGFLQYGRESKRVPLSSTIGGTLMAHIIQERHAAGAVIAGTSAGASAMSTHMVAFGASGASPRQRMAQLAAGLGVLPDVIVDQHFQQRNRLGRLLSIIAQNPALLGIGIDEDTAGVVGPDHVREIIGRRSVTIVDGGVEERGGEPGEAAMGAHGAAVGGERLRQVVRPAAATAPTTAVRITNQAARGGPGDFTD